MLIKKFQRVGGSEGVWNKKQILDFFHFATTLATSDFLKSIYQYLFKNLFFISNYSHYHRLVETFFINFEGGGALMISDLSR